MRAAGHSGSPAPRTRRLAGTRRRARTRNRVARSILDHGPSTVGRLAERLGLTQAAVRRHLDALVAEDVVEAREQRVYGARARPPRQGLRAHRLRPGRLRPVLRRARRRRAALDRASAGGGERGGGRRRLRPRPVAAQAEALPRGRRGRRPRGAHRGPGRGADRRRVRCYGAQRPDRSRRAALPAPLPGRPCRRAVPAAVRGGDRGLRPSCSARTSSGSPPSPTATASARPSSRTPAPASRHSTARTTDHHSICKHGREEPRMTLPTETAHPELEGLGNVRIRLGRLRRRRRHRQARPQRGRRPRHLGEEERAGVDAQAAPQGPAAVRQEAHADLGLRPVGHRLRQHQVLRALHREAGRVLGGPARGHQEHLRQARHPGGGEAAPGRRCRRAVRVRGRLPPDPRGPGGAGRHLPRHRHRAEGAPGALQGVLRHGHPGRRQQVRRR